MSTRFSRHDVSYLISAGLLLVALITATTGLISDLWDLNDFVFHKVGGYTLAALALAHVYLHWGRLLSYARWRIKGHPKTRRSTSPEIRQRVSELRHAGQVKTQKTHPLSLEARGDGRLRLSRRDFLPLTLGGAAGLALGHLLGTEPELPFGGDIGILYHEWSKPRLRSLLGAVADWGRQPPQYKEHPNAPVVLLPPPGESQGMVTEEAIRRRRSRRNYGAKDMKLEELSRLLHHTGGITANQWGHALRSAPSAGALYPIEIYLVIHRVAGLDPGLYHYAVPEHALELLRTEDMRGEIVRHGLMQAFLGDANLVIIFTAIFQRLRWKYQERSYRYALLEAGHLGQNVYLAATSMGAGACAVGAFLDEGLNDMLGVDGLEEAAVYMLAVGTI